MPVVYRRSGDGSNTSSTDLRLVAFSTTGIVLANQLVTTAESPTTTNICSDLLCQLIGLFEDCIHFDGEWPFLCPFFGSGIPLESAGFPLPGVAIRADPQGGAPLVMVTDGRHDKVAYAFSPQAGFSQVARSSHFARWFTTPPVVRSNGDTLTGSRDGYLTGTDALFRQLVIGIGLGMLTAAPTRLADGRLVVVSREGIMTVLGGRRFQVELNGASIASAAASCNHVFVASTQEFATYDARTLAWVTAVPWVGGGLSAPVIGPTGHVYAIASDSLYVFPRPSRPVWDVQLPSCAVLPPI